MSLPPEIPHQLFVRVTQYYYPDGRQETGTITLPHDPERRRKYDELTKEGCNITGEVLPGANDRISTTISNAEVEDDFVVSLTEHPMNGGPSGNEAVGLCIDKWDLEKFRAWKTATEADHA